jgi:hypothetical protein
VILIFHERFLQSKKNKKILINIRYRKPRKQWRRRRRRRKERKGNLKEVYMIEQSWEGK